jgi:chromate transporter
VRDRPITSALLDGVNAAAIGLMGAVSIQLGVTAVRDPLTALIAISAAMALIVWRFSSVLMVLAGGIAGLAASAAGIGP